MMRAWINLMEGRHGYYRYVTCCVDGGHGPGGQAIHDMVDRAQDITLDQFIEYVDLDQMIEMFPDYDWSDEPTGLTMAKDYAMQYDPYHVSKWYGIPCVYLEHSGVEYIFTKDGNEPEDLGINRAEYLSNLDD